MYVHHIRKSRARLYEIGKHKISKLTEKAISEVNKTNWSTYVAIYTNKLSTYILHDKEKLLSILLNLQTNLLFGW